MFGLFELQNLGSSILDRSPGGSTRLVVEEIPHHQPMGTPSGSTKNPPPSRGTYAKTWFSESISHFFKPRTKVPSSLISSSERTPPNGFIFCLPSLSFMPSLICLATCS